VEVDNLTQNLQLWKTSHSTDKDQCPGKSHMLQHPPQVQHPIATYLSTSRSHSDVILCLDSHSKSTPWKPCWMCLLTFKAPHCGREVLHRILLQSTISSLILPVSTSSSRQHKPEDNRKQYRKEEGGHSFPSGHLWFHQGAMVRSDWRQQACTRLLGASFLKIVTWLQSGTNSTYCDLNKDSCCSFFNFWWYWGLISGLCAC
jgi:hypothetical protein